MNWIPTLEDFDAEIINKLRTIRVDKNGDGNLQPIHVTYFTPEAEGAEDRDNLRPAIAVFMYDQSHDIRREHSILTTLVNDTPTDISLKRVPTPMKFFYQFLIATDYQKHMVEIINQLNMLFPTRGYITLEAPDGEKLSYDFFLRAVDNGYMAQFLQFGTNQQERMFRKVYRYHLFAEVDEYAEQTYKKVLVVNQQLNEL